MEGMAPRRLTPIRIAKAVLVALLALVIAIVALVYLSPETATRLAIDAERARRLLRIESAELLHRRLPRSRVAIMRGVGHLPMLERPAECAAEYIRFRVSLPD